MNDRVAGTMCINPIPKFPSHTFWVENYNKWFLIYTLILWLYDTELPISSNSNVISSSFNFPKLISNKKRKIGNMQGWKTAVVEKYI